MKSLALFCLLVPMLPAHAQLEGVIDLHVHSAPDSVARSVDAIESAQLARRHGKRALLFKNHYTQTASLAYPVAQVVPGIEVYGGIALNRAVGGVNPFAVRHMIDTTGGLGRVVWMPTFDSEHGHRTVSPNPDFVPVSREGALLPNVLAVLDLIAEHELGPANVVLSTDLGQAGNPVHTDGFNVSVPRLLEAGLTQAEIDVMTKLNPARFLGLP